MRIRIWGARGSIPSSIKPEEVEEKICRAILGLPDIDPHDEEAVRAYVGELPPLLRGTAGGNTPCVEIQAGGELFVVDAGSGFHDLGIELLQGPFGRGEGTLHLLISHLHWDHIQGFPMFMPAFVPGNRIFVYGIHDVKAALEDQQRPPKWSVSLSVMKADIEFIPLQVGQPFSIGNVRINTIQNTHPGRSYSYRFQDRHSVLVYASDAEYKQLDVAGVQPHIQFFRNADVLIFDAQYTLREAWQRVDWGHSSAMIGIDLARSAGVKKLLLFHHDPTYSDAELQKIQSTAIAYQSQDTTRPTCEVIVAYEGLVLDLIPPGAVALQLTPDGEAAILTPTSVFDELGVDQLAQQLSHLAEQDAHASSIIDLSQVETLTTASLKSLVALRQERKDTPIVLAAPSDSARQVIKLGRYLDYFAIYPSVEDALAAVHTRETLGLPGQVIKDRYQIQNKVGESQLGIVLTAMDTHLNRTVALKIFSPSFSEETIARFARQAGQIMSLDHRSIVQVLDWDSDEGYSFKVEEFVAGPTLQGLLFDSYAVFSASQAVDTAMDIARALEYAHSWGVLHGDLKPQNVFLTDGQVKVSGFGLGLLEEGRNLLDTPLIFLTASHLAPEQILGQPLDARTDLYALGVILYQLFTGHKPFEGTDREVMHAHLHLPPRPPRELNPHLSLVLEHLILKLLAKNPSDRYASAREVWCILASLIASTGETVWQCGITLVGREEPLRALQACWEDACAGRGQLALISGESGIGKTSLAQQVALQSKPSVLLVGRGWELEGSPPYHLVTEALQPYFAAISSECFDEKDLQLLGSFAGLVPGIRRILPDLPEPTRLEPDQEQLRLMASLTQFIKRVTREQPWFIVLDDLQWADQNSLKLLCYLGRHLPSMSLLIVGTYHDAELEWGHPLRGALRDLSRQPTYHDFPLGRLDQAEVGRVLTDIWLQPAPADLTEKIYQHTRGNPFYVGEVARGLVDDGLITLREGKRYFPGLDEVRLPQDVREAIWRRIRHLSPDTQTLLRYAAVLGQTFRLDDLQEISGLSEWEVLEHLDMALERRLVQESPGEALLRFCHPEIQDVLYADLGPPRRRLLHCRAGEALERRAGLDPEHMAEELAYHFSEAGEVERALAYSVQAAHRAEAAHANGAALLWYNQTLEMLNQLGPEKAPQFQSLRLSAHESLGDVLARIGQYDEALEHYASALFKWLGKGPSYFDEAVPSIETARIYIFGAELYYRQGRYDEAISWCQKSLDIASQIETLEGQQAKARACYLLGDICIQSGDLSYAVQFCRESLQIYQQIDDLSGQAGAYSNLGLAYYRQGDWLQARESFQESLTIRKQVGDVGGQGQINNHLALIHINRGEWPQAMNLLEQSRAIWEQIGVAKGEANTMGILARVFMHQENWVEARVCLSQNQVISIEVGYDEHLPELERHWGEFYLETGELDAALDHARRSVELAVDHSNLLEEGMACRVLGQVHLARGELEPAEAALHQSLDILSDLNSKYEATKTKLALVRLVLETGLTPDIQGEAQSYLVQAIQTFEKLGAQTDLAEAQSLEL